MKNAKYVIVLSALFLLSSCSLLSPIKTEPISTYMLTAVPCKAPKKTPSSKTLLVSQPDTRPAYNTTLMAYTTKPYQIAYFGLNQWAETPSQMLLPLIVHALQSTCYYRAVVTSPYMGKYHYVLSTQILQLQQNYVRCPHVVELTVRAQIYRADTNQVVATRLFCITVPIRATTPYCGVIAANKAMEILLEDLTKFILHNT